VSGERLEEGPILLPEPLACQSRKTITRPKCSCCLSRFWAGITFGRAGWSEIKGPDAQW